jgi:hypothetical protein
VNARAAPGAVAARATVARSRRLRRAERAGTARAPGSATRWAAVPIFEVPRSCATKSPVPDT